MQLVILANDELKVELMAQGIRADLQLTWINDPAEFSAKPSADGFIDLLFDNSKQRTEKLKELSPKPVIANTMLTGEVYETFICVNGWPSFLKRNIIEAYCRNENEKAAAEKIFGCFNKKIEWVAEDGFISANIVSAIINEAYLALEEEISTKEQIDVAMKLGTNYPFGPFEWAQKIGVKNIYFFLDELSKKQAANKPAALLKKEALL